MTRIKKQEREIDLSGRSNGDDPWLAYILAKKDNKNSDIIGWTSAELWRVACAYGFPVTTEYKKHGYRSWGDALGENTYGAKLEYIRNDKNVKIWVNNDYNLLMAVRHITNKKVKPNEFVLCNYEN